MWLKLVVEVVMEVFIGGCGDGDGSIHRRLW